MKKTIKATEIIASMDIYEKIAIFCILVSLLIGNFTALFYIWRNQRVTNTLFQLLAEMIQAIQRKMNQDPYEGVFQTISTNQQHHV